MTKFRISLVCISAMVAVAVVACGEDEPDQPSAASSSGSASSTSFSASSGTGGGGGDGGGGGLGGGGGDAEPGCPAVKKAVSEITEAITADTTLTADKDYLLKGTVFVENGAKLTIEPCTKIMGDNASLATLVVEPGSQLIAKGTANQPIVFTSQAAVGDRAAGDWGGVMLLGNAPINVPGGKAHVEGIVGDGTEYGGTNAADNSGVLEYVRIEYSGILLSTNNEVNGLTLAGVGSGTTIDHVMVHHTLDDCFEFFGGTVNAKHLICSYNGDDGFDWDFGYGGKLQFLALQQDPSVADETNGFEGDNDADASSNVPVSKPTIYNATLCGKNAEVDKQQYGMLLRRSTTGSIFNTIVTGFEAGVDVRNALTSVELKSSIFFGNLTQNIAYAETATDEPSRALPTFDDDNGFDEIAWFQAAESHNAATDPQIRDCFKPGAPDFRPMTTLGQNAATPPNDGFFDTEAAYIGAFKADDTWATGAWVSYDLN